MGYWGTVDGLSEWLHQTQLQILLGAAVVVSARYLGTGLYYGASLVFAGVRQAKLRGLIRDLALYKFLEANPVVLAAKTTRLNMIVGLVGLLFCCVWVFVPAATLAPFAHLAVDAIQIVLSGIATWILVDTFNLVRPLAEHDQYQTGIQLRINKLKKRLGEDEQVVAKVADENAKLQARLDELQGQPEEQDDQEDEQKLSARDEPQTPIDQPPPPPATQKPDAPEQRYEPGIKQKDVSSGSRPSGSVYQTVWIRGRVKSWGQLYGFIRADSGEQFFAPVQSLAGLEPPHEGQEVLFQALPDQPHRRASLVCAAKSYAEGRVNGIRGNMGFITIQDGQRGVSSIYFRLPVGSLPNFNIGQVVGFRFGRNILGPTAVKIDPVARPSRSSQY